MVHADNLKWGRILPGGGGGGRKATEQKQNMNLSILPSKNKIAIK